MGNLHVLNTINLHQQLRTMVKDLFNQNKSIADLLTILIFLFVGRRNCA